MHLLSNDIIRATAWALIHSLWQGLVLALVAGILILFTRKARPALRYNIFTALFFLLVAGTLVTFLYELRRPSAVVPDAAPANTAAAPLLLQLPETAQQTAAEPPAPGFMERFAAYFNEHAPLMVMLWFIVFVARSLWLFGGLVYIQRIRHYKTAAPDAALLHKLQVLSQRLRLNKHVQLLESALIKVPTALGMLKPVILMPLGMMAQLPPDQVEAVLLHELAHIRRRDFLVNLLQHFAETVFFFNPALLWLSARIREEREHCCDDMAIALTESRTGYIQALVSFQEYQLAAHTKYALAFPGKKKQLLQRVKRILGSHNKTLNMAEKSFLLLCFSLIGMLGFVFSQPEKKAPPKQPAAQVATIAPQQPESVPQPAGVPQPATVPAPKNNSAPEATPAPESTPAAQPEPEDYYAYDKPDSVTEGTTLAFSGGRNGVPYKVYLYKRDGILYQAKMDDNGRFLGFRVNGKQVYREGEDERKLAPYTPAILTLYNDYKLPRKPDYQPWQPYQSQQPHYQPYQPYQPQKDSVPVLRKGSTVLSGTISTAMNGVPYKITVDNNKATGLVIDGVKVPDEELPSKYRLINEIFRQMEQKDREADEEHKRLQEADRIAAEKMKEAQAQKLASQQQLHLINGQLSALSTTNVGENEVNKILDDMLKDGLITQKENVIFELDKDQFMLDKKPQPAAIHQKYSRKYIKHPSTSYNYTRLGKHSTTHINTEN